MTHVVDAICCGTHAAWKNQPPNPVAGLSKDFTASAPNAYRLIDGDPYAWQSVGRKVEGEFAPNTDEVSVVRKGAEAAAADVKKKKGDKGNDQKPAQSKKAAKAAGGKS